MSEYSDIHKTTAPNPGAIEAYTIREVRLLLQAEATIDKLRLVKAHECRQTRYEIYFTVLYKTHRVDSILINSRNRPYRLADLNRGLQFLRSVFNRVHQIELVL